MSLLDKIRLLWYPCNAPYSNLPPPPKVMVIGESWSHTFSVREIDMHRKVDAHFRPKHIGRQTMTLSGVRDDTIQQLKEHFSDNYDQSVIIRIVLPSSNTYEFFGCQLKHSERGAVAFSVPPKPLLLSASN